MLFGFAIAFRCTMSLTVVPYLRAIDDRLSPACTVTVETDRYFYREAIGPLLVAELIKLVGQTNAELDTWVKNFAQ